MASLTGVPDFGSEPPLAADFYDSDKDGKLVDLHFAALHCFPKLESPPQFGDKLRSELEPIGAAIRLATAYCQLAKSNAFLRKLNARFANGVESVTISCGYREDLSLAIQLTPSQIFFYKTNIQPDEVFEFAVRAISRDAIFPLYLTNAERSVYRAERCPGWSDQATRYRFGSDFMRELLNRRSQPAPSKNVVDTFRDVIGRLREDLRQQR